MKHLALIKNNVTGTDLAPLEGKKLVVKRIGKRKTVVSIFSTTISINNKHIELI